MIIDTIRHFKELYRIARDKGILRALQCDLEITLERFDARYERKSKRGVLKTPVLRNRHEDWERFNDFFDECAYNNTLNCIYSRY